MEFIYRKFLELVGGKGVKRADGTAAFIYFPQGEGTVLFDMKGKVKEVHRGETVISFDGEGTMVHRADTTTISREKPEQSGEVDIAIIVRGKGVVDILHGPSKPELII